MKNKEQDAVTVTVDALAMLNDEIATIEGVPDEWKQHASMVINHTAAVLLEMSIADGLQTAMIDLLSGLHARAIDDREAARAALAIAIGAGA